MNKKGNFWFWFGICVILFGGLVLFINLDKFSQIPPDSDFITWVFGFSFIIGAIIVISALLKKNP